MFILRGVIKDDKNETFVRKDGNTGVKRSLFIEPTGSIYPVTVNVPMDKDYGQIGNQIEIEINVFPFCFVNKQRQRAYLSIYVPDNQDNKK
jgi:hypothetical protein